MMARYSDRTRMHTYILGAAFAFRHGRRRCNRQRLRPRTLARAVAYGMSGGATASHLGKVSTSSWVSCRWPSLLIGSPAPHLFITRSPACSLGGSAVPQAAGRGRGFVGAGAGRGVGAVAAGAGDWRKYWIGARLRPRRITRWVLLVLAVCRLCHRRAWLLLAHACLLRGTLQI